MSGIFKAIGKVFSKIVSVVVKIAPFALAAAAVVFTGGAALGLLPTFGAAVGGLVSSLGLSAAVTGALTGAITSAGFGAALGFITGGTKGMQKGALFGALSGGVLGAINPTTFGIVKDPITGGVTTAHDLATGAAAAGEAAKGIAPISSDMLNPSVAPSLSYSGGSLTDVVNSLPQLPGDASNAALSQAATLGDASQAESQAAVTQATSQAAPVAQGIAPLSTQGTGVAVDGGTMNSPMSVSPDIANPQVASSLPGTTGPGGVSSDFYTTPATGVSQATAARPGNILSNLLGGTGGVGGNTTGLIGSVLQALGPNQYNQQANAEVKAREQLGTWAYGGSAGNANGMTPADLGAVPMPRYYYDKATNTVIDRQQPAAQGS